MMELLETLALKVGCEYLSDLRYLPRPNGSLQRAAAEIPPHRFSPQEWLDAADYLCGIRYQSAPEARNAVLSF